MRTFAWLVVILVGMLGQSLAAGETGRTLSTQMKSLLAARADTTQDIIIRRLGTMTTDQENASVEVGVYVKDNLVRIDAIIIDSLSTTLGMDTSGGKKADRARSKALLESQIMVSQGKSWTAITARGVNPSGEFDWREMAMINWLTPEQVSRAKVAGEEKIRGRDCWVLDWDEGVMNKAWVDKSTMQLVRATAKSRQNEYRLEWSDFRAVSDSWMMPYQSELFRDGKSMIQLTTTEVKTHARLWEGLFEVDKIDPPKSRDNRNRGPNVRR